MKPELTATELREIIEKAAQGDDAAYCTLYKNYYTALFRYLYYRVKNRDEAEDLLQVVFLKIYEALSGGKEFGDNPVAYIYKIARNTLIDHWRKEKVIFSDEPLENFYNLADHQPGPLEQFGQAEQKKEILDRIRRLKPDQQEAIIMRYINELSYEEIALITGKNEAAIRQQICRGFKKIRETFAK